MDKEKLTSIKIRKETAERLKELGRKGESYDDVLRRILDRVQRRRRKSQA